ncbi:MAG TPA: glycosyltransferase family 39 protein [Bryobacteraceae bacterium]|nr:glycosyltransferase family 39 protein [Bryobacteraceae bacterium]
MTEVIPVIFGALVTVATAWSLGMLLFRRLGLVFHRWEERLLAFVAGSACLSALMFVLCALRLVRRGVVGVLAAAIIAYAIYSGVFRSPGKTFPPLAKAWRCFFGLTFAAFTYLGFFNALAPEHSSDGMAYHLYEIMRYQHAHGFFRITTDIYANLSEGVELIYLFALNFGRFSSASLVHFTFLVVLALLILSYGKRIGKPQVGAAAALFTFASPLMLRTASIAYVDVALAASMFALFYLLQGWDETRDSRLLIPIGLLAGFGYEIKYTAIVAVPYAVGFIAWKLRRDGKPILRPALVVSAIAASCIAPWMVKNWTEVANPVSPFANRLFPNPYVHVSFEDNYRKYLENYDLKSKTEIPMQVTVRGTYLEGFFGPLFLLTPLALIALRHRAGRQLWLAAAIFGSTYFTNIGARFLIPIIPFVSLAIAMVAADVQWLLPVITLISVFTCWPDVYDLYSAPGAFRIEQVPMRAALRLQNEQSYLSQDPDYMAVLMAGKKVAGDEPIFAVNQNGQSYLQRDLRTGYESAQNEVLQDILWTAVLPQFQPRRLFRFDFPARDVRKLRVVATVSLPDQWSVSEFRVFHGPNELARDPGWRLSAHPNPWDVQLAFDNSPVTRWRTWQAVTAGDWVEMDFGKMQSASAVTVDAADDNGDIHLKLEGMGTDGAWTTLSDHPTQTRLNIRASLRLAAIHEFKQRGIRYLLIRPDNPGADDFHRYPTYWGIQEVDASGDIRLYRIP